MKKPSLEQIEDYLKRYNPLNLAGAEVELISEHNHLIYRLEKDNQVYCLRMINPETYRAGEWLSVAEEYTLLKLLESSGLGPKAYYVDPERFSLPLLIQDFVAETVCFNDLKPLSEQYLQETAKSIARLNSLKITPENFPFRFWRSSYLSSFTKWQARLVEIKKDQRKEVLEWAERIEELVARVREILEKFESVLEKASSYYCLNFDGAHCGNVYWKKDENKVIFLDWEKVSFGDPAYTLARFLTSVTPEKGTEIPVDYKKIMIKAYLEEREVPDFEKLIEQRLFERQVADLVWVLWDYVRSGKTGPVEEESSVVVRYQTVQKLLNNYK